MAVSLILEDDQLTFQLDPLHRMRRFGGTILVACGLSVPLVLALGDVSRFQKGLLVLAGMAALALGLVALLFRLRVLLDRSKAEMIQSLGIPFTLVRQRFSVEGPRQVELLCQEGCYTLTLHCADRAHNLGRLYDYAEARQMAEAIAAYYEIELRDAGGAVERVRRPAELAESLLSRIQRRKEPGPKLPPEGRGPAVRIEQGHAVMELAPKLCLAHAVIFLPPLLALLFGLLAPMGTHDWRTMLVGAFGLAVLGPAVLFIDPHTRDVALRALSKTTIVAGRGGISVSWVLAGKQWDARIEGNAVRDVVVVDSGAGTSAIVVVGEPMLQFADQLSAEDARALRELLRAALLGQMRPRG